MFRTIDDIIAFVLQLGRTLRWRRLYQTSEQESPCDAAFFFAAGSIPDAFKKSPELCRRIRSIRLPRQVPEWSDTSGGDTAEWRSRNPENARIANSILTHVYQLCAQHNFSFDKVADALGLGRPDEGDADLQVETLHRLYRHCRGEDKNRILHQTGRYGGGQWVDAMASAAQEILTELVPEADTAEERVRDAIFHLQQNLQMVPWNDVLQVNEPAIMFEMRRHGTTLAMRFREERPGLRRGQHRVNELLPAIPGTPGPGPAPGDPTQLQNSMESRQSCQESWQNSESPNSFFSRGLRGHGEFNVSSASFLLGNGKCENSGGAEGAAAAKRPEYRLGGEVLPISLAQLAEPTNPMAEPLAGHDILGKAGYPADVVILDFETYFDAKFNLNKLDAFSYVVDPRFHCHGAAIRWPEGRTEFRTDVGAALAELRSKFGPNLEQVTVVGHNWQFDGLVLDRHYGLRPQYTVDTLALARQWDRIRTAMERNQHLLERKGYLIRARRYRHLPPASAIRFRERGSNGKWVLRAIHLGSDETLIQRAIELLMTWRSQHDPDRSPIPEVRQAWGVLLQASKSIKRAHRRAFLDHVRAAMAHPGALWLAIRRWPAIARERQLSRRVGRPRKGRLTA